MKDSGRVAVSDVQPANPAVQFQMGRQMPNCRFWCSCYRTFDLRNQIPNGIWFGFYYASMTYCALVLQVAHFNEQIEFHIHRLHDHHHDISFYIMISNTRSNHFGLTMVSFRRLAQKCRRRVRQPEAAPAAPAPRENRSEEAEGPKTLCIKVIGKWIRKYYIVIIIFTLMTQFHIYMYVDIILA